MKFVDWKIVRARQTQEPWSIYARATMRFAEYLLTAPPPRVDQARHNWVLEQARVTGKFIITLAGAYRLTDDKRFAERAWFFFADALAWPHWFWLGDPRTQGFALSTGELAVTCHFIEDWLADYLSDERRAQLDEAIRTRIFSPYLAVTAPTQEVVWYRSTINWNAVCNGGVLALALQRSGRNPQSAEVIQRSEQGLKIYIDGLHQDGSLPESVGYWQYGVIHLAYALLACERHRKTEHPAFRLRAMREGLSFPFDFTPDGGAAVGFGDCNFFLPQGFLFALADRANRKDITSELNRRMTNYLADRSPQQFNPFEDYHPTEIFSLVYSDGADHVAWSKPHMKVYPDVGWGVFSSGPLTLGFRAGTTESSHSMRDLAAVNLACGGEALLAYVENLPYCRGWFNYQIPHGSSRELFFEDNSTSKNTLLANGIGQIVRSASDWKSDDHAMWCDATPAYSWFVKAVKRRVEATPKGFLLSDEVETDAECWHEARFFTAGGFKQMGDGRFELTRGNARAEMIVESEVPMHYSITEIAPSIPIKPSLKLLRIANQSAAMRSRWKIRIEA